METNVKTPSGFYRSRIYTSSTSINPLIVACDPVLTLMAALKTIEYPDDRDKFLEDLAHEIRAFEHRAQISKYPEETIKAARYALCCLLDETIALTSEWGKDNGWLNNNLLTIFYDEGYGGEYFFTIIDDALENTSTNLHLIELLYICLSFGFEGKHRHTQHGKTELESIADKLYQGICQHRYTNNQNLFVHNPKQEPQPQQKLNLPSTHQAKTSKIIGITVAAALIISGLIYFGIHLKLRNTSKSLYPMIERNINFKNKDKN